VGEVSPGLALQSTNDASTEPFMTPHTRRKLIHYWRRQIRPILVLVLVFTSLRSSVVDWNDVPTGSMKPTIFEGDRIFVNKLAYGLKFPFTTWHLLKWSGPQRGEIAVFYSPADGIRLVKRVIGLPGEHVVFKDGLLTITDKDGKVVPVSYTPFSPPSTYPLPRDQEKDYRFLMENLDGVSHPVAFIMDAAIERRWREKGQPPPMRNFDKIVPNDEYFMMGDNRDNSNDSRYIGSVKRSEVLGRASRVIFSLDYDDSYLPRKNRFFKGLP
jgi:signal peptidase I